MSSLSVYPGAPRTPTTREVHTRTSSKLWAHLDSLGIHARPDLRVQMLSIPDRQPWAADLDALFEWDEYHYQWWDAEADESRIIASCGTMNPEWGEDPATHGLPFTLARIDDPAVVEQARVRGRYWRIQYVAPQPPLARLVYGCLASALAELTSGVLFTTDHVWDHERFPARPAAFDQWYLRPDQTQQAFLRTRALETQRDLRAAFQGQD
ncbi:hypothetical protein LAJ19_20470 (plasmid) [Deinococcus taeanensis]|uniref:hypothetical protein n=1 Tax=Deinococcus taeanensis TaxID=2737050 RepID=UPI001CDC84D3|nr:hypothetical protein [Deinococcus taeanensis]UBV45185.1 hypothetical protein LAJ19_20470 [Deinococcus taeanensis]